MCDGVQEESRREGTQQEILDRGLRARGLALAEAGHDVGRDRRDFQSDEDHQQLGRAGHEHHADRPKQDQRVIFAGVPRHSRCRIALKVIERRKQRGHHHGADQQVEEDAEAIDLNRSAERAEGAEPNLKPADAAGNNRGRDGQPAQRFAAGARLQHRLNQHDQHAGDGEDVLRQQRDHWSGEGH
jgi:hypothetical protein